jgi:uroporphyrinogen decarboxylase
VTATKEMIDKFGKKKHIANLGHGIYPDINHDHLKIFIDTVYQHSSS